MDVSQWEQFAKHRSAVIRDYGMWIGLMDNNMEPIVDMPAPVSVDAPITRMTPSSCKAVFKTRVDGHIHPMVDYLIAEIWRKSTSKANSSQQHKTQYS